MTCHELERFLFPYLDGEFDAGECAEFELHLASCSECAARVNAERAVHDAIRAKLKGLTAAPGAPAALADRIREGLRQERRHEAMGRWTRYAAAAAVVAVAGSSAWVFYRPQLHQRFVEEAVARHSRNLPLDIQESSPRRVEDWFVSKLDHRVPVPTFPNAQLAGARITNVQDRQAAYIAYEAGGPGTARRFGVLVYEDKSGETEIEAPAAAPERASARGYNVVSWRRGDIVYQLVNDLDDADIRQLLAHERPSPPPSIEPRQAPMNPLPTLPVQPASFRP